MNTPVAAHRHAAVILAGGAATRMGGVPKPELTLGGRSLVRRVLDAVPQASPRVVVGEVAARDFIVTAEDKPGSGPAYALAAGLAYVPDGVPLVVALAGDMPFLTPELTAALCEAVKGDSDGAVLVDHNGRRQWLCGVWRRQVLAERLAGAAPGSGVRQLLGGARIVDVSWLDDDLPPWFDCDTPAALAYARQLEREFRRH